MSKTRLAYVGMPLTAATDPDASDLLECLGLTDEHPMGWLRVTPELREAEWRGLVMILGRSRPDGRQFVVAKTEAGVRAWRELARECAKRWERFPVLDGLPAGGVRVLEAPDGMKEHYRRQGYFMSADAPDAEPEK